MVVDELDIVDSFKVIQSEIQCMPNIKEKRFIVDALI